ncbi:Uncharacterised protein [Bordetella pertussis]|nr:Uncharacterised protein [Bordetella pertussis]
MARPGACMDVERSSMTRELSRRRVVVSASLPAPSSSCW